MTSTRITRVIDAPRERVCAALIDPVTVRAAPALGSAAMTDTQDPDAIFKSLTSRFSGRMDVKLTSGPDDAPLLKAAGNSFAMLHGGTLVVRLHPGRCAELVDAGQGHLFVHEGRTLEDWIAIDGTDPAEWKAHTMEALGGAQD